MIKFSDGTPLTPEEVERYERGEAVFRELPRVAPNEVHYLWVQGMFIPSYDYFREREDAGA